VAVLGLDKPARWRKTKHPTFEAFTKPKNLFYLLDPETSGCTFNVPQIWIAAVHLPEGFYVSYVSFSNHLSKRPLTGCVP